MPKPWTETDLELLITQYSHKHTQQIADALQRNICAIYRKAQLLGLKKSEAFLNSPEAGRSNLAQGQSTRFQKGHTPWNKGKKGIKPGGRAAETQFKPGSLNGRAVHLYQPVGAERIGPDGIRQRKIKDDGPPQSRWRAVHALLWEQHHGPIPVGHVVVFKDGDRNNITIENLELVSRSELMKRNSYHNYPKEIGQLIRLRGAIQRQINKRVKHA